MLIGIQPTFQNIELKKSKYLRSKTNNIDKTINLANKTYVQNLVYDQAFPGTSKVNAFIFDEDLCQIIHENRKC
jgi:hypothetical protein